MKHLTPHAPGSRTQRQRGLLGGSLQLTAGDGQITISWTGPTPPAGFTLYEGDGLIEIAPNGQLSVFEDGVYDPGVFQ